MIRLASHSKHMECNRVSEKKTDPEPQQNISLFPEIIFCTEADLELCIFY